MNFYFLKSSLGCFMALLCLTLSLSAQDRLVLPEVNDYHWTEGWTTVRFFESNDAPFVFLGKTSGVSTSGHNAIIHRINIDGSIGDRVYEKRWSEGWTSVAFYEVEGQTYMLRLKERGAGNSGYNVHIDRINNNGTVGSRVRSYGWSEGWSTVRTFVVGGKPYLFLLKEQGTGASGKNAHIHPFNSNGTIAQRIYERKWSEGWTNAEFFQVGGQTYFFQLKQRGFGDSGNNARIRRVNTDGTLGRTVQAYRWDEGWSNVRFFEIGGITYSAFLRTRGTDRSGKNCYLHRMTSTGRLGAVRGSFYIESGWTTMEFYDVNQDQYMFRLRERGYTADDKNVYIHHVQQS